jgi:hypothetical protein
MLINSDRIVDQRNAIEVIPNEDLKTDYIHIEFSCIFGCEP